MSNPTLISVCNQFSYLYQIKFEQLVCFSDQRQITWGRKNSCVCK